MVYLCKFGQNISTTPKESSNAYTFVLAFSWKLEFRIEKYFGFN